MDDSHSQSGREDVASLGDQTLGEVPRSELDWHYLRDSGWRTRKKGLAEVASSGNTRASCRPWSVRSFR